MYLLHLSISSQVLVQTRNRQFLNPRVPRSYLKNKIDATYNHTNTNQELMNIILLLDENKSSGPSSIPVNLKTTLPVIITPLYKLINHFFDPGVFPNAIKISTPYRKIEKLLKKYGCRTFIDLKMALDTVITIFYCKN